MNRKIKLIWDFRSEYVQIIAQNHSTDVQNFSLVKKLPFIDVGVLKISNFHSIGFVVVDEINRITFRDLLNPHRAELAE